MRTMSLDNISKMVVELFDAYIEPYAYSIMSGELPAISLMIYRTKTKDGDWSATVRLKNSLTISVFRCEVYIPDIINLCKTMKLYLQTPEVLRIVALFYMLHGLCQQEHMHFDTNTDRDYESMMVGAGYSAYKFIKNQYNFQDEVESIVLDLVYYQSMIFTNNYKHAPRNMLVGDLIEDLRIRYFTYMNTYHHEAFRSARRQKAQMYLIDEDGFILLEKTTASTSDYDNKNARPVVYNEHKRDKKGKILY